MSDRDKACKDIVTDILERVESALRNSLANDLGFEQSTVDAIAATVRAVDAPVRRDWARHDAYVPARAPVREESKRKAVEEAKRSGKVADAARRNGISRATIYRLLNKR